LQLLCPHLPLARLPRVHTEALTDEFYRSVTDSQFEKAAQIPAQLPSESIRSHEKSTASLSLKTPGKNRKNPRK
jgi:hypothetical protein